MATRTQRSCVSALRAFSSWQVPVLRFRIVFSLGGVVARRALRVPRRRATRGRRALTAIDDFGTRDRDRQTASRIVSLNPDDDRDSLRHRRRDAPRRPLAVRHVPDSAQDRPEPRSRAAPERRGDRRGETRPRHPLRERGQPRRRATGFVRPVSPRSRSARQHRSSSGATRRLLGRHDRRFGASGGRRRFRQRDTRARSRARRPLPRPTVFFRTWEKPIIAIGGGSFLNELVEIAGGTNVYARS